MKPLLLNLWAWVASDPVYATGAVLVALVMAWKALPAKLRASIEARYPRPVGIVRTLVALAPDLIGAARVMRYQTVAGQPRSLVSDRAAAEADKLRAVIRDSHPADCDCPNCLGAATVPKSRETQAPPAPDASGPQEVSK